METKPFEIALILCDIMNSSKIDGNGFIRTEAIFTARDLEQMKSYIMETQSKLTIRSRFMCEAIQKINNILHLWQYKNE